MEINAKVYAVAADRQLLKRVHTVLSDETFQEYLVPERLEPCTVLPLTRTWYGFTERAEPTGDPEEWLECLEACAGILLKNGAVLVEFRSPDNPDEYLEYAYTTPSGHSGCGGMFGITSYDRVLGHHDITMALHELMSGRNESERRRDSWRKDRKEAVRKEKGDYEITSDGILKRYRGIEEDVVIPDGVKVIGDAAFCDLKGVERMLMECEDYDAPPMETLTIPDSVVEIRDYAFAYCQNLVEVHMPDSVRKIDYRAFEGCESLKKINLPVGLTEICDNTFFLCESLKTITIPESVRHIREGAFWGCAFSRITLPEGLVSIGEKAFYMCPLKKVVIPESVTEIAEDAFPEETQVIRKG